MIPDKTKNQFDEAINSISDNLKNILYSLPNSIKKDCNEIRLRRNKPVVLTLKNENYILCIDGSLTKKNENTYICTEDMLTETFSRICEYSVHTHLSDLKNGFITLNGGHRAGVAGKAALNKDGEIVSIKDISSVNIRVAREVLGCSNELYSSISADGLRGILIVGPPSSGKTTVLRDLIRNISENGNRVSVIDERQEITGENSLNIGVNTDVFINYPKCKAITLAIRTMSPQYIAVDEICENDEISALIKASNCGVKLIATMHASSLEELKEKPQIYELSAVTAFNKIVILKGADTPGAVSGIYEFKELKDEILRCRIFMDKLDDDWNSVVV